MRRRRCRGRRPGCEWLPLMAIAFGLGLMLALFGSVRLVLFFAAVVLIYLGITSNYC